MGNITINTSLCYIRRSGKTLILHRDKKPNDPLHGKWIVPGGKFEPGESPLDCALREVWEETGLILKKAILRGIITFVVETPEKYLETCHTFVFESPSFTGRLIDSPEGYLKWVHDPKISSLDIFDKDKIFTPWVYKNKKFFYAKFYSIGSQLKSHNVTFF